jgi:excisionase family DNA binding protein
VEATLVFPDGFWERLDSHLHAAIQTQNQGTPEYMTAEEAAEFLRCAKGRIHNLVSQRRIPHYKEGGRLLFERSRLIAWLESGEAAIT